MLRRIRRRDVGAGLVPGKRRAGRPVGLAVLLLGQQARSRGSRRRCRVARAIVESSESDRVCPFDKRGEIGKLDRCRRVQEQADPQRRISAEIAHAVAYRLDRMATGCAYQKFTSRERPWPVITQKKIPRRVRDARGGSAAAASRTYRTNRQLEHSKSPETRDPQAVGCAKSRRSVRPPVGTRGSVRLARSSSEEGRSPGPLLFATTYLPPPYEASPRKPIRASRVRPQVP